jgi:heat shock protein HslJ
MRRVLALALAMMSVGAPAIAEPEKRLLRTWRVVALAGEPIPGGVQVTMALNAGGRIGGTSGCNRYGGQAQALRGGALAVGPLMSTRMACPPPRMEVETRFLALLQSATRWSLSSGRLMLTGPDGGAIAAVAVRRRPGSR